MSDMPKLLTEAEWRDIIGAPANIADYIIDRISERGLIAQEPVEPLLIEARKQAADYYMDDHEPECAAACLEGRRDDYPLVQVALAALRRGMELRPALTREQVREAVRKHVKSEGYNHFSIDYHAIHTALTEALNA